MARETAAERKARLYEHVVARQAAYPERLMKVLERASRVGFELTVREGKFHVVELNEDFSEVLTLEYTEESDLSLDTLFYRVEDVEEERAEANRRDMVRRAALSKLSQEERELLGL
jgi:hypothetical protein